MEYRYEDCREEYYATALLWDTEEKLLRWTSGNGQDAFIIQTPFGVNPIPRMAEICKALKKELPSNRFFRLPHEPEETEVCFISARDAALGCRGNGEACRYTVFPCVLGETGSGEGLCQIFAQNPREKSGSLSSPFCDVPLHVRVVVEQDTRESAFFFSRRNVPTGFYHIRFPDSCDSRYRNGFLEYRVGAYFIPITRSMFEHKDIYVRTDIEPEIVSSTPCVELMKN